MKWFIVLSSLLIFWNGINAASTGRVPTSAGTTGINSQVATALAEQAALEYKVSISLQQGSTEFAAQGLTGIADYLQSDSKTSLKRADAIVDYFRSRGASLPLTNVSVPDLSPIDTSSPAAAAAWAAKMESATTQKLSQIASLARQSNDEPTANFVAGMLETQTQNEAEATRVSNRLSYAGAERAAIMSVDAELSTKYAANARPLKGPSGNSTAPRTPIGGPPLIDY